MTEHHPAIAEQITEHEAAVAEITASLAHHEREQARLMDELRGHQSVLAAYIDAEQRLIAALRPDGPALHARIAATFGDPAPSDAELAQDVASGKRQTKRMKRDVRGAVMACLAAEGDHLVCEAFIVERTGLPEASVRAYLGRAVKAGELVREGDLYRLYRLPQPETTAAINTTGAQQAFTVEGNMVTAITPEAFDEGATAEQWQEEVNMMAAEGAPWPPSPEKIVDTIRRAGDMGLSATQLTIIGATDDQLDELLSAGRLDYQDEDRRYRVTLFEDGEEPAP